VVAGLSWGRIAIFFAIAILGCAADLLSKEWVFRWRGLPRRGGEWWIPGLENYVGIETSVNRGALFGMGEGLSWLFAALSVAALVGVIAWFFWGRAGSNWFLTIALGCVAAGILGNLYDRLGLWDATGMPPEFHHGVRDWILFRYGAYTWPNFNIADSLLVCGAIVLAWRSFVEGEPEPSAASQESSAP
jgi:signal peptidase II